MVIAVGNMTDEQITLLGHVEALFENQNIRIAEFSRQQAAEHAAVLVRLTAVEVSVNELTSRLGQVEGAAETEHAVIDAKALTRKNTLKMVALAVTGTIASIAALGGFVLAVLQVILN